MVRECPTVTIYSSNWSRSFASIQSTIILKNKALFCILICSFVREKNVQCFTFKVAENRKLILPDSLLHVKFTQFAIVASKLHNLLNMIWRCCEKWWNRYFKRKQKKKILNIIHLYFQQKKYNVILKRSIFNGGTADIIFLNHNFDF